MSDEQNPLSGSVRRVGRKDRKTQIEPSGGLFPPEGPVPNIVEPLPFEEITSSPDEVDAALQALDDLDALSGNTRAQSLSQTTEPQAERFPPVKPETAPRPKPQSSARRRGIAWQDMVAIIFFFLTFAAAAWMLIVWQNPHSPLNPFAPPTPFIVVTATLPLAAPEDTSEDPLIAPTASFTPLVDFLTPAQRATESPYVFALSEPGILYAPNGNGRGCDWASIAGTVSGLQGEALDGYAVQITGEALDDRVFSGTTNTFGPGGFELFLNGVPQQGQYTVQLFSPAGAPLSDKMSVTTSSQCEQNVVIINFIQLRPL